MLKNLFPYEWRLADGYPAAGVTAHKSKVFTTFSCGGGSSMGYKLAGYEVIGANDIDPKMMDLYVKNHDPKHVFTESISALLQRDELPDELYNLAVLDGSPPCSTFSMSGNRENDWGKSRKFKEGQADQVLDELFFDFIALAKRLKPKIAVAENVKGLLLGEALQYVRRIYKAFDEAGYHCQHFLLNSSSMGVPQERERVFFIALRKDLSGPFMAPVDMFTEQPKLMLKFNSVKIPFREIEEPGGIGCVNMQPKTLKYWLLVKPGEDFTRVHKEHTGKRGWFNYYKLSPDHVLRTIIANTSGSGDYHYAEPRQLSKLELCRGGSYPVDYDFKEVNPKYVIGMSVPPVMMAQVAHQIYQQWLSKIMDMTGLQLDSERVLPL